MKTMVLKEIQLLMPACVMAVVLAILPLFLLGTGGLQASALPAVNFFALGAILVSLSSFGREFSLHTFPLILAQPVERTRIWRMKIVLLAAAIALLFVVWLGTSLWFFNTAKPEVWRQILVGGATAALVAYSSGLWTTLLLRHVAGAFWFSILVPLCIIGVVGAAEAHESVAIAALLAYSAAGFCLARHLFRTAQEPGWTGGVVSLPRWGMVETAGSSAKRAYRPVVALIRKELQLHKVGIIGMVSLFVLHLLVVWLRKNVASDVSAFRSALEVFGGIWLIVPAVVGAVSVAEERKLGTLQNQLCLPISATVQFIIKLLVVFLVGAVLSSLLFWTAEGIGQMVGAGRGLNQLGVMFLCFCLLSLAGFYGSTIALNVVQAMAYALAGSAILILFVGTASEAPSITGVVVWSGQLVQWIAWPILLVTLFRLGFGNFRTVVESTLWRRNFAGWTIAFLAIFGVTWSIYHRAWEYLMPVDLPPGPAQMSRAKPPVLRSSGSGNLAILLPDGRVWADRVRYDKPTFKVFNQRFLGKGWWVTAGDSRFFPGSEWVDVVPGSRETVAIKVDGSLWLADTTRVTEPIRVGDDSGWVRAVREQNHSTITLSVLLLKRDGTLWRWGTNDYAPRQDWPGLQAFEPYQLGTNSDWASLESGAGRAYIWNRERLAWVMRPRQKREKLDADQSSAWVLQRSPHLDGVDWRSFIEFTKYHHEIGQLQYYFGVRPDGTLWGGRTDPLGTDKLVQVGTSSNWVAVAGNFWSMAALRADGSLWRVELDRFSGRKLPVLKTLPMSRLGGRTDWLTIVETHSGIISLAADGNLFFWWPPETRFHRYSDVNLIALGPSRRPSLVENIFAH